MGGTVILANPKSGPESTSSADLAALFPEATILTLDGAEAGERAKAALAAGATVVGVAGGDGTVGTVAEVVAGTDAALLVVPTGTRNHFASDLGIADVDAAVAAARAGEVRAIDVGEVNGRTFINNANIGLYPAMVRERATHERRWSRTTASLIAAWRQLRHGHRVAVEIDDLRCLAWVVFVGNGRYGESITDITSRDTLDDGVLDVRIVRADGALARLRVTGALLTGRMTRSRMVECRTTAALTLDLRRRRVADVAIDGEVVRMESPLRFCCRPQALKVLAPIPG